MAERSLVTAFTLLLAFPAVATATSDYGSVDTLLGWSEDGQTWAVLTETNDGSTLRVLKNGKEVLTICNRFADMGSDCTPGKGTVAVEMEDSEDRSGLERINIETHRALKKYKLKRVAPAWRKGFKKAYQLKRGPYGKDGSGNRCSKGWSLERLSDKKLVKQAKATKDDCIKSNGGYLHPNGKYALVKATTDGAPDDEGDTSTDVSYTLVKL